MFMVPHLRTNYIPDVTKKKGYGCSGVSIEILYILIGSLSLN